VLPVVWLILAVAAVLAGAAGIAAGQKWFLAALAATLVMVLLSSLRALRIWLRVRRTSHGMFGKALAVAMVYDAARAAALFMRMPHRRAVIHPVPAEDRA
jgi:hypothetical protein